jgi:hypothetical protein
LTDSPGFEILPTEQTRPGAAVGLRTPGQTVNKTYKVMQTIEAQDNLDTNLDQLLDKTDTCERPFAVLTGHNMGNNTLLLCVPMHQFWEISEVANERNINDNAAYAGQKVAQRKLDMSHAAKLATYILKGLFYSVEVRLKGTGQPLSEVFLEMQRTLGKQPYLALQPLTANIRECVLGGKDLRVVQSPDGKVTVYFAQKHVLWVVDGQHRREAMRLVFEFLRTVLTSYKYPKASIFPGAERGKDATPEELRVWASVYEAARTRCKVMVEVHLGLNADQERQLFHDLNNLTKKVESSLAFQFDNSNPINLFIKEELIENGVLEAEVVEKDVVNWQEDRGAISRKDLIAINAILFLSKTNISGANPADVESKKAYARRFWEIISAIPNFGAQGAKRATTAAQPVVLKALAKLAYFFGHSRNADAEILERVWSGIPAIDFSHQNPMWRYYNLALEERDLLCPGLKNYLPPDEVGVNRDVGVYDASEETMRFGVKHNDIYPILGDMIRWKLDLPSRHAEQSQKMPKEKALLAAYA